MRRHDRDQSRRAGRNGRRGRLRQRIAYFQAQVAHLRQVETNPVNYHAAVSGFIAEIDRMQLEVREYLSLHPPELAEEHA
jgi:hypothetical protein